MELTGIYNVLMTVAIGFIGWSLKELYGQIRAQSEKVDQRVSELEVKINDKQESLYKVFVTKDDHSRDINALEQKIDGIRDILLDIKEDIGFLTGRNH